MNGYISIRDRITNQGDNMNYKLVLCGVGFLQELELKENDTKHSIGTNKGCIIRFDPNRLGDEFQIDLFNEKNNWKFFASAGVIFVCEETETSELSAKPGEKITVKSKTSDRELFTLDFFIDYGLKNVDYDLKINLSSDNTIKIGEKNCDIIISGNLLNDSSLVATRQDENLVIWSQ